MEAWIGSGVQASEIPHTERINRLYMGIQIAAQDGPYKLPDPIPGAKD